MSEEIKLKSCPFCGGEAEVRKITMYLKEARAVACKDCGTRTRLIFVDLPALTDDGVDESTRYTAEQAEKLAVERWNRRVGEKK